jgi:alpha-L-rhamnosidase
VRGRISSSWKIEDGLFSLEVLIPPNTTATVHLPSTDGVSEDGRPVDEADGVEFLRAGGGETVLSVGSGRYEFAGRVEPG